MAKTQQQQQPRKPGRPREWTPTPLGARIEAVAAKRGMSIDELSTAAGIDKVSLYRVLSGKTPDPRLSTVLAIATALRTPISRLVG